MRGVALIAAGFFLLACAAPQTPVEHQNQPHLPPPAFPVSEAPVGQSCGGSLRTDESDCDEGQYCHRTIAAQCGASDAPGVCRPVPELCTLDYNPVCGCDGKTYSNECAANAKRISAAYEGECKA